MSVNSYLENLSSKLVIKPDEKSSIKTSIDTLEKRLGYYFNNINEHFCFGSYTRETILPRLADSNSDIDYMIVFSNPNNYKPQTLLNHLKKFAEIYYSSSEIFQSYPTLVLNLNHIKFELVPAYNVGFYYKDYKIPAPSSNYEDWISTDPNSFNKSLVDKNVVNNSKIKPMIRLIKYWNSLNGHIYSSYQLEKHLINVNYGYFANSLRDYFSAGVNSLPIDYFNWSTTTIDKVKRLKETVNDIINDDIQRYPVTAENKIKKLLPNI